MKKITFETLSFRSIADANRYFFDMVYRLPLGKITDGNAVNDLFEILPYHHCYSIKFPSGAIGFIIEAPPGLPNKRRFAGIRPDKTTEEFSYRDCMGKKSNPMTRFLSACRYSILPVIAKYRQELDNHYGRIQCEITGGWFTPGDIDIDHAPPNPFSLIVSNFARYLEINIEDDSIYNTDAHGNKLLRDDISEQFKIFHGVYARLRPVLFSINRSMGAKCRSRS